MGRCWTCTHGESLSLLRTSPPGELESDILTGSQALSGEIRGIETPASSKGMSEGHGTELGEVIVGLRVRRGGVSPLERACVTTEVEGDVSTTYSWNRSADDRADRILECLLSGNSTRPP